MKKFLVAFIFAIVGVFATNAQVWQFRGEAYCQKYLTSYGTWTNWSNWERCNVPITINLNNDQVTIYSNVTQRYQITQYSRSYYEGSAQCIDYNFYDQDGDRGTMTLAMKSSGQSEIYIRFANIQWAYTVIRTN